MREYAPIYIPTLNRYEHFKKCIVSLLKCKHSEHSRLFIGLDYPTNTAQMDGYKKIDEFIDKIKGFKDVHKIKRQNNLGMLRNYTTGIEEIFNIYDRIIITEDDNYFSPNFLEYINKGLDHFKDDNNVYAICGYNYPIQISNKYISNYYYYKGFSAWGYGTWKNRHKELVYSYKKMNEFLKEKLFVTELNKISGRHLYNIIASIVKQESRYGDFAVFLNNIIYHQYCVFPTISKVRNYGHDGTGVHCGKLDSSIYETQEIDTDETYCYRGSAPLECNYIIKELKKYFKLNYKRKIIYPFLLLYFFINRSKYDY